jgi:hypothetical protein
MPRRPRRLDRIHRVLGGRPRALTALVATLALVLFLSAGTGAWFAYDVTAGLPDREELASLGDMAQSTTILDAADSPVFTIFKEQRIEIPLDRDVTSSGPGRAVGRGPAVLRAQRRRRRPRRRGGPAEHPRRPARRRGQHDHPAARAPGLSHPSQDVPAQAAGGRARDVHRERVHEGRDPRDLPEQGLFRGRLLRRGGRRARVFQQARQRSHRGGGRAARRADPVALELRAQRQHGARRRPAQRRAPDDGEFGRHRCRDGRARPRRPRSS